MLQQLFGGNRTRRSTGAAAPAGIVSNSYLNVTDGDAGVYSTSALVAAIIQANTANTSFSKVWEKTVPAGQMIGWGHGSAISAAGRPGYVWFAAMDVGTGFEDGTLRLQVSNARETRILFVSEYDTRSLHTVTSTSMATAQPTTIDSMIPLPFSNQYVKEDSKLQLFFRTSSATTTVDATDFSIPVQILQ